MISFIIIAVITIIVAIFYGVFYESFLNSLLCTIIGLGIWITIGAFVPYDYTNIETYNVQSIDGIAFYIDNNNIYKINNEKITCVIEDVDTIQYRKYIANKSFFLIFNKYELVIPEKAVEET